jgi:AraC family transcriptional regulator
MFIDPLPLNVSPSVNKSGSPQPRTRDYNLRERPGSDRHAYYRWARPSLLNAATDMAFPTVEISPSDVVRRRIVSWPGMVAEITQVTRNDRIESRFCAPVHLLAMYERGVRQDGGTIIEGLPKSTLRDFGRKLSFVPAGNKFHDWQEPQIPARVIYFYLDPSVLAISSERDIAETPLAPRLFFEDGALWDTALKLTASIENAGSDNQLYIEALGVVLAHELLRLNAGTPRIEPQARGGLAAWQQRTVVAYVEEHLDEPISLATLAQLVGLSPHYFCRAFKQSFGTPPHRFHTSRRIERAKILLAKPAPSVTDIGFTVGFSQTSSFTAAFRKATGTTPTAYHRSLC